MRGHVCLCRVLEVLLACWGSSCAVDTLPDVGKKMVHLEGMCDGVLRGGAIPPAPVGLWGGGLPRRPVHGIQLSCNANLTGQSVPPSVGMSLGMLAHLVRPGTHVTPHPAVVPNLYLTI